MNSKHPFYSILIPMTYMQNFLFCSYLQTNVSDENRVAASVTKAVKPKSRRVSFSREQTGGCVEAEESEEFYATPLHQVEVFNQTCRYEVTMCRTMDAHGDLISTGLVEQWSKAGWKLRNLR